MWKKIDVIFKLKAPLHIGYIPFKGSVVSPTRYYIPGRNFWGAVTKRITEAKYTKPSPKNYRETGKCVMENFRFSYFYIYHDKDLYMPHYEKEGLKFGEITKEEFEHKFIASIISTAIDSKTKTAKDESLHEIEFINNEFKDEKGNTKTVKISGCIYIKNNGNTGERIAVEDKGIVIEGFNIIQELILGGESKYGFGHVLLDSINLEDSKDEEESNELIVKLKSNKPIPAHLEYAKNLVFKGDVELLTGRGYYDPKGSKNKNGSDTKPGVVISKPEYYLSPGTIIEKDLNCEMNWDGTLKVNSSE